MRSAWVIERGPETAPHYLTSHFGWSLDPADAHLFACEEDAMAYRRQLFWDDAGLRVAEVSVVDPA